MLRCGEPLMPPRTISATSLTQWPISSQKRPQQKIVVVIDAPTSEQVEQASAKLLTALRQRPDLFLAASEPGSGRFFEQNGLLFLPDAEVARITGQLSGADTFIATL